MEATKIVTLEGLRAYTQKIPQPDFNQNNPKAKNYIQNRVCHTEDFSDEYETIVPNINRCLSDLENLGMTIETVIDKSKFKYYCRVDLNVDKIPKETKLIVIDYKKMLTVQAMPN